MQRLSARNARVAEIRALSRQRRARAESGRFVVEGAKLINEAIDAGVSLDAIYFDHDGFGSSDALLALVERAAVDGIDSFTLESGVVERVGSSTSPQPVIAVANGRTETIDVLDASSTLASATLVLVLVDINDPGNMGTMMRSAVAAGADAVVLLGNCVDVFNPKVVRSSAGALFHVPVLDGGEPAAGLAHLGQQSLARVGTSGTASEFLYDVDLAQPTAVVVGNETHGLAPELGSEIDTWLSIPMSGPTESLNAAMAATLVLYEALRQRRTT